LGERVRVRGPRLVGNGVGEVCLGEYEKSKIKNESGEESPQSKERESGEEFRQSTKKPVTGWASNGLF